MLVFFGELILGTGILYMLSTVVDCEDHGEGRQSDSINHQPGRAASILMVEQRAHWAGRLYDDIFHSVSTKT
jgi:hypothetical protein